MLDLRGFDFVYAALISKITITKLYSKQNCCGRMRWWNDGAAMIIFAAHNNERKGRVYENLSRRRRGAGHHQAL